MGKDVEGNGRNYRIACGPGRLVFAAGQSGCPIILDFSLKF
jgi:hypothetical protein